MEGVEQLCHWIREETGHTPNFDEVRALRAQFMAAALVGRGLEDTEYARRIADDAVLEFYR